MYVLYISSSIKEEQLPQTDILEVKFKSHIKSNDMLHDTTIVTSLLDWIIYINVIRFAKPRHTDAFLEIQIFASVSSIHLKLCSVAIPMLYCKYFSSYKVR